MPFHPDALSVETLRDLAKNMKKGAAESLGHPIKLAQAQDLLAKTFGYSDWKSVLEKRKGAAPVAAEKSSSRDHSAVSAFCQSLERELVSRGLTFFSQSMGDFTAEEMTAADGLLPFFLAIVFQDIVRPEGLKFVPDATALSSVRLDEMKISQEDEQQLKKKILVLLESLAEDGTLIESTWERKRFRILELLVSSKNTWAA